VSEAGAPDMTAITLPVEVVHQFDTSGHQVF